jgi:WD40 repeat protein
MDGSDINAVCRSRTGHLIATSDDFGKVNVFRYPCNNVPSGKISTSLTYSGHSSHVMNVKWTVGDEYLVSVGGNEKTIMLWKHSIGDASSAKAATDDDDDYDTTTTTGTPKAAHVDDVSLDFEPTGGDESGCVKPWLGAVKTPKNPPPFINNPPNVKLDLDWVYGLTQGSTNGKNICNNMFYNWEKSVVYPAAALGVVMKRKINSNGNHENNSQTQQYFKGHDDDIICLAISSNRKFVATGQVASKSSKGKGSISVWDAVDSRLLCKMEACHQRGVSNLSFSPDGTKLLSVGQDDKNTHILFSDAGGNWSRTTTQKGDQNMVIYTRWANPGNSSAEYSFVSGGGQSIFFWKIEGGTLSRKQGKFGKFKGAPILCAANLDRYHYYHYY